MKHKTHLAPMLAFGLRYYQKVPASAVTFEQVVECMVCCEKNKAQKLARRKSR